LLYNSSTGPVGTCLALSSDDDPQPDNSDESAMAPRKRMRKEQSDMGELVFIAGLISCPRDPRIREF
jgi:hypothetical protein